MNYTQLINCNSHATNKTMWKKISTVLEQCAMRLTGQYLRPRKEVAGEIKTLGDCASAKYSVHPHGIANPFSSNS